MRGARRTRARGSTGEDLGTQSTRKACEKGPNLGHWKWAKVVRGLISEISTSVRVLGF